VNNFHLQDFIALLTSRQCDLVFLAIELVGFRAGEEIEVGFAVRRSPVR
jgi:hypothetical protein